MEGYHFRGIWAASCLFPDRERYLVFVPVGGWVGYSFSFGGASACIWGWRVFPTI